MAAPPLGDTVIVAFHEIGASRHDGAASFAVAGFEYAAQVFGLPFAFAYELQAARHGAHLAVRDEAGACGGPNVIAVAGHFEPIQRAQRRFPWH